MAKYSTASTAEHFEEIDDALIKAEAFERVEEEMRRGQTVPGLFAECVAACDGDMEKAQWRYRERRADIIAREIVIEMDKRIEAERIAKAAAMEPPKPTSSAVVPASPAYTPAPAQVISPPQWIPPAPKKHGLVYRFFATIFGWFFVGVAFMFLFLGAIKGFPR